ncbi:hypothetical protein HAHE_30330 [Haloferula helveola]|uniref:Secreted protein n=1 Tax=Haloferula helveola TaxID=490095 RepID=A0ABM7REV1_9BACT|nr:hypothetical protein HAHE_30330 [Haloferula helveola]
MILRSHITTAALAIAGAGLWHYAGSALRDGGKLEFDPNPLGIKRSPYGQVVAMAIQTPIDADWHGAIEIHDHPAGESCESCEAHSSEPSDAEHHDCDHEDCDHDHIAEHDEHGDCEHDHGSCGHDHDHADHGHGAVDHPAEKRPLLARLENAVNARTNPNPPTPGHKLYIRREIEKKLRFAYALDPSHYANYNAYNLFITQQSLGTGNLSQEQADELVFSLADHTIRYCLREQHDPRPALTAASAAYNCLERMLLDSSGKYPVKQLRDQLGVIDFCIHRHFELLETFIHSGSWDLLSAQRQDEIMSRSRFASKLRESAEVAITRKESESHSTASHTKP